MQQQMSIKKLQTTSVYNPVYLTLKHCCLPEAKTMERNKYTMVWARGTLCVLLRYASCC